MSPFAWTATAMQQSGQDDCAAVNGIDFESGYENRRVNVTLLFGRRNLRRKLIA
jgi:hypothetical protein